MFVDTHCHLYQEYYDSIDEVIERAQENHIKTFFVAGCDRKSNEEVMHLCEQYASIYGCVGIHPENVESYIPQDIEFLNECVCKPKVIAIGEIGLDYHYTKENKEEQKILFERQLMLAEEYGLPVVIHSREATQDTIDILRKYPDVKGVIHSFSGSLEVAKIYIQMGYKLGINGVVTFKNSRLKELLPEVLDSIILETDSPYLTPHPYRGTRNEPKYVLDIAKFIAEYCDISLEELAQITEKNIKEIFKKY